MFSQSGKKQTTLSFAPKPAPASAVRGGKPSRPTPYSRMGPRQSSEPSLGSMSSSAYSKTGAKSGYFGSAEGQRRDGVSAAARGYQRPGKAAPPTSAYSNVMKGSSIPSTTVQRPRVRPGNVKPTKDVVLSQRQREAFDLAVNGKESMFITGSAGTGKSVLLREVIGAFKERMNMGDHQVVVTASTGIAAFHIGGKTIHSFAGVGLGKGSKEDMLRFVRKSNLAKKRWSTVEVLVIDEVSMLDANLFDALEFIARELRGRDAFFGGVQVILTGDFYQLPPVDRSGMAKFAFESQAWKSGIQTSVVLTHVFRQKDMRFVDMLNELRLGRLTEHSTREFAGLARRPEYPDDGIQATELYALRNQVDTANQRRLQGLQGKMLAFNGHDSKLDRDNNPTRDPVPEDIRTKIDGCMLAPRRIELKRFAQVMLVKNMPEEGLVNGSRGVIVDFKELAGREYPVVRFTTGAQMTMLPETYDVDISNNKYRRTQLPLILAWALSIHKSQGQTIERLLVDLGKVFEKGQAYVALSRAVRLDSLQVLNFSPQCVMAHPRVVQYYADLARMP